MLVERRMTFYNSDLLKAFPLALRDEAQKVISVLPETRMSACRFSVDVGEDLVSIPYRIYHDPALIDSASFTRTQHELLACLMTRHHNGFVREEFLPKILGCNHEWVPPFVVQLVGEYVIEIIQSISDGIHRIDPDLYRAFLTRNPAFYRTTKKRMLSYWDCYHRAERKEEYAGFRVLEFFDHLIDSSRA
jgi:hypothetical protein